METSLTLLGYDIRVSNSKVTVKIPGDDLNDGIGLKKLKKIENYLIAEGFVEQNTSFKIEKKLEIE